MSLPDAIAGVCAALGTTHLRSLAEALAELPGYDPSTRAQLGLVLPGPHRPVLTPLLAAWAEHPGTPGAAIAMAIETARASVGGGDHPEVSIVCTGPDSPRSPVRLTSQVVHQLIEGARSRVTISSFSSYQIPTVMAALERAVTRGVQIDLILESQDQLQGGGGAESFAGYRVFVWPPEKRPDRNARLHAKTVTVDDDVVLLTSANLSAAAFDRNLELGALIRGGDVARTVQQHFDALIADGILVRCAPLDEELILDAAARELTRAAIRAGAPVPVAGYEPDAPGAPGWQIEVAWPDQKVAVLTQDDPALAAWLESDGWTARASADWDEPALIELLRTRS
jgi:phosphatidylserine/phosphatidylglycerophosphate/cardiolipin synthase-like enzyme